MEEALFDVPLYREFAQLPNNSGRLPDESTILRLCHLLERHELAVQMCAAVNATLTQRGLMLKARSDFAATLIPAPNSTKNSHGERDPEMHQTSKGNNWRFGMKANIGVDAQSGPVHHVVGNVANVHDLHAVDDLLSGNEKHVFADSGYRGVHRWSRRNRVKWSVAIMPRLCRKLDLAKPVILLIDQV